MKGNEFIITDILNAITKMLIDWGFEKVLLGGRINYKLNGHYCIPRYSETLGFFVERAHSFDDAKNNFHEDGDCHPLYLGKEEILSKLKEELCGDILTDNISVPINQINK